MRIRVSQRPRAGQSLVEFALLLPVMALLMTGALDLGRIFYAKVTIANASRAAAEVAVNWALAEQLGTATATDRVRQRAIDEAGAFVPLTASDIVLEYDDGAAWQTGLTWQPGQKYRVTVRARFVAYTPLISQLLGSDPFVVTHRTEMRHSCTAQTAACSY